ncbi:MAG: hypothetical protein IPO95_13105 [Rhodanobacteraceae bacterium]|nr:hypothetical protein [Rhodanobacteraceae bacterium]
MRPWSESTGDLGLRQYDESYRRHFGRADAAHRRPCADRERIKGLFGYRGGCREEVAESSDFQDPRPVALPVRGLVFDKVAPVQGSLVTNPRVIIPTIISACLAIDHDDGNFNCNDEQASP